MVMMPVLAPRRAPRSFTVHSPPLNRPFLRLLRRQTSLSPADGKFVLEAAALAHAHVVGAPRGVAPDQHLVGLQHALRIEIGLGDHFGFAVAAGLEIFAGADVHRQADDRVVVGLPVHLGEHHVGLGLGEKAAALDRRQLRRIAQHQQRHAERQQVAAELGVDHRAFVDDDQLGLGGRRLVPQIERGDFLAALARPVDQASGWWRRPCSPCRASPRPPCR